MIKTSKSQVRFSKLHYSTRNVWSAQEQYPKNRQSNSYLKLLIRLRIIVFRTRKEIVPTQLLHHDKVPGHTTLQFLLFLVKHELNALHLVFYTLDLTLKKYLYIVRNQDRCVKSTFWIHCSDPNNCKKFLLEVPVKAVQDS